MLSPVKRIKVVKDLIIDKLDSIHLQLQTVNDAVQTVSHTASSSLENEISTLQAAIHLVETLQKAQAEDEQQFSVLLEKVEPLLQEIVDISQQVEPVSKTINTLSQSVEPLLQKVSGISQQIEPLLKDVAGLVQQVAALSQRVEHLQQQIEARHQTEAGLLQNEAALLQNKTALLQNESILLQTIEGLQQQNQELLTAHKQKGVSISTDQYLLLNPEVGLMSYLYSYLPNRNALDIGANTGDVSEHLLQSGYEVYAFEPFSPVFDKLKHRLNDTVGFHPFQVAIGAQDGTANLHIATDLSGSGKYGNSDLFSSLFPHSMLDDLKFTDTVQVQVRSLDSLHQASEIPPDIGLLKIDTEGADLEVIRGMGEHRYSVIIAEFWDEEHPFGKSNAPNKLGELVVAMKQRGYHWYIVIHRTELYDAAFYCNYPRSVKAAWGNVFFFQSHDLFTQGLKWCSATLPTTYFRG